MECEMIASSLKETSIRPVFPLHPASIFAISCIYTTTATVKTLDESPMAYKGMDKIVENIAPTAEIIKIIKPVYNFKAE